MEINQLQVEEITDGYSTIGYIVKGHHEVEPIIEAIRWFWNDEFVFNEKTHRTEQTIARCIPMPPGSNQWYSFRYAYSKPGRGAFECTFLWIGNY